MNTRSHSLNFFLLALLTMILASLACTINTPGGTQDVELSIQQTLVSLQQTQIAMGEQKPTLPPQEAPQEQNTEVVIPQPTEVIEPESPDVSYEGISFSYDPAIAQGTFNVTIPGQNLGEESMPGETYPTHFQFTFENYAVGDHFHTPVIRIYPVEEYRAISTGASNIINELQQALINRPGGGDMSNLPFLPMWNAAQVFTANVEYFDFQSGSGVRYLTMYGQALYPVDNTNLFYTYQGLTQDNRYYITAILPVTHPGLPAEGVVDDWAAFTDNWDSYIADTLAWLEAQNPASFTPSLELLDQMMASFKIER